MSHTNKYQWVVILHMCLQFQCFANGWYESAFMWHVDSSSPVHLLFDARYKQLGDNKDKFWGTNICYAACFPDKQDAPHLAQKIKTLGFNLVRFHHMDSNGEPDGIFKKNKNIENEDYHFSDEMMDRLCFFINELKIRDIFIDLNLLVSRTLNIKKMYGDPHENIGLKGVALYYPEYIHLQKTYIRDLLSYFNQYTQTVIGQDSHLAFVEILNENSLFWMWKKEYLSVGKEKYMLTPKEFQYLNTLWNQWIIEKSDALNEMSKKLPGVLSSSNNPIVGIPKYTGQENFIENEFKFFISEVQKRYFDQMVGFIKNELNYTHKIIGIGGIREEEDQDSLVSTDILDTHGYWDHPRFIEDNWDKKKFKISNISIFKEHSDPFPERIFKFKPTMKSLSVSEWGHCYPNEFAYESPMKVALLGNLNGVSSMCHFAFLNGMDAFTHPKRGIQDYFDTYNNTQQLYLLWLGGSVFLSEHNWVLKKMASGPVCQTQHIMNFWVTKPLSTIEFKEVQFEINRASNVCIIDLKTQFQLTEVEFLLFIVAIGRIKNAQSQWLNGYYQWGKGPVLMEDVMINLKNQTGKLTRLNDRGLQFFENEPNTFKTPCWIYEVKK